MSWDQPPRPSAFGGQQPPPADPFGPGPSQQQVPSPPPQGFPFDPGSDQQARPPFGRAPSDPFGGGRPPPGPLPPGYGAPPPGNRRVKAMVIAITALGV
ncbi:MAG: hypothetical protein L0G99_14625, partial [Propionibacteriales bacterium]|nr:hypothetical protein [Propionibacteriales bacterium]